MKSTFYFSCRKYIYYVLLLVSSNIGAQEPEEDCHPFLPVCGLGSAILIRPVAPMYPIEALRNKIEGWVDLQIRINSVGIIVDVKVLNSEPAGLFEVAAQTAVKHWRFKPSNEASDYVLTPRMFWRLEHNK